MPFGLRNAPATFQRMMDQVLDGMLEFAGAYIDDIIIYSQSWEDHMTHAALVIEQLKKFGSTAKPSKYQWGASSLTFLEHTMGGGTVSVPDCRVIAIKQYVRPVTKCDVHAFLRTTGYYRKFIPWYAHHSVALTAKTRKAAPNKVVWTETTCMCNEFQYLRTSLYNMSILTILTHSDKFLLQTDASARGITGVLSVNRKEEELPVGFFSRQLRPAETRYSATELEGLSLVKVIQHIGKYLLVQRFYVETDHKALAYLHTSKHLNGRVMRWALLLQP